MDPLHQYSLDRLIERAIREQLVDACEHRGTYVVIVQGATRFVLSPVRAHAFLRGVIKGMSARYRGGSADEPTVGIRFDEQDAGIAGEATRESGLVNSFRRHLLEKWWTRYERAGCPFGSSRSGLMVWVRYGTFATAS